MKLPISCGQCSKEYESLPHFIPALELHDVILDNQFTFIGKCSRGHESFNVLQVERFEILYMQAIQEFLSNDFRACVFNCASALERFYEFFIEVYYLKQGYTSEQFQEQVWIPIKNSSNKQLELFENIFSLLWPKEKVLILSDSNRNFRNHIIHQGGFPKKEQTRDFVEKVFVLMGKGLYVLEHTCKPYIQEVKFKHVQEQYKSNRRKLPSATIAIPVPFPSLDKRWDSKDFNKFLDDSKKQGELSKQTVQAIPILNLFRGNIQVEDVKQILIDRISDANDEELFACFEALVSVGKK